MEDFSVFGKKDDPDPHRIESIKTFIAELNESMASAEEKIIEYEKEQNKELVSDLFRIFHNTKGSSSMLGFRKINEIVHYTEDIFSLIREGIYYPTKEDGTIDIILESIAAIKTIGLCIEKTNQEGNEKYYYLLYRLENIKNEKGSGNNNEILDTKINSSTETVNSEEKKIKRQIKISEDSIEKISLLVNDLTLIRNRFNFLQEIYQRNEEIRDLKQAISRFSNVLQKNILELRLSSIKHLFQSMHSIVRNTSKSTDKTVNLVLQGEDTQLDRNIVNNLSDPLIHILRNAVDHGIEDKQRRESLSKPEYGTITLKAENRSSQVIITITDDGGGINIERVKQKAKELNLYTAQELEQLSTQDIFSIIFMPGFSSVDNISDISGRGVGMDVVKDVISKMDGHIEIQSEQDIGTTFRIFLPLSIAIVACLGVKYANQAYAIPQMNVEEVLSSEETIIQDGYQNISDRSEIIIIRSTAIPLLDLSKVLDSKSKDINEYIILRFGKTRFAIGVEKNLGPMSIVTQPCPANLDANIFSGVTKLGNGELLLQLDVSKLVELIHAKTNVKKSSKFDNRGKAGTSMESSLMTSSEVRRMRQRLITFQSHEYFAIPVQKIKRIEPIQESEIRKSGHNGKTFVNLSGEITPLLWLEELLFLKKERTRRNQYELAVFAHKGVQYAIPMGEFFGIKRMPENYNTDIASSGILGASVIDDVTFLTLDLPKIVSIYNKHEEKDSTTEQDEKFKILAAEDDKFFATELISTLKGHGYDVYMCEDGAIAKNKLLDEEYTKTLRCIVTDIEMPNITGIGLIKWIKSKSYMSHLPIVVYTAITSSEMRSKAFEAGADHFVSKMSSDMLIDVIKNIREINSFNYFKEMEDASLDNERIVTFIVSDMTFGLPINCIKEAAPVYQASKIQSNNNYMKKITLFRNKSISILDLNVLFDFNDEENMDQLVIEVDNKMFAVTVSKIGEVFNKKSLNAGEGISSETKEAFQESHNISQYVSRIYSYNNNVIFLLDPYILAKTAWENATN